MSPTRVELYLDEGARPVAVLERAPFRFQLDTTPLAAGSHALRIEVAYADGSREERHHLFEVAAGEALALEDVGFVPGRGVLTVDLSSALEPSGWVPNRAVIAGLVVALLLLICGGVPVFMMLGSRPPPPAPLTAEVSPLGTPTAATQRPAAGGSADGASLYAAECASCHQPTGRGVPDAFPSLLGDAVENRDSVIDVVLRGRGAMPSFPTLQDREVAAVATYVRGSWGNAFGAIGPDEVAARR